VISTRKFASRLEGFLWVPESGLLDAAQTVNAWKRLGIKRICAPPNLLETLNPSEHRGIRFTGTVGYPTGCHTLGTKRMEALECVRFGAKSADIVLTPELLRGPAGPIEREMSALLSTVPELDVFFAVEEHWMTREEWDVFLRVLRDLEPPGLMIGTAFSMGRPEVDRILGLQRRAPKKTRVKMFMNGRGEARTLVERGVDIIQSGDPGSLLSDGV